MQVEAVHTSRRGGGRRRGRKKTSSIGEIPHPKKRKPSQGVFSVGLIFVEPIYRSVTAVDSSFITRHTFNSANCVSFDPSRVSNFFFHDRVHAVQVIHCPCTNTVKSSRSRGLVRVIVKVRSVSAHQSAPCTLLALVG